MHTLRLGTELYHKHEKHSMRDIRYYEITLKMRRPEIAIYSDIIDAISQHGAKSYTKIQNSANLEYERMKRLMKKMQKIGLLDEHNDVTDKGKNFRKDLDPAEKIITQIYAKYFMS